MEATKISFTSQQRAIAHGGASIGNIAECPENPTLVGKACFIPFVAPNEKVLAEIEKDHKSFIEANLLQILEPHPSRVKPPCPYFTQCGGCDLQFLTLEEQRNVKLDMVRSYLQKHADFTQADRVSLECQGLEGWHYRKRVILHLNREGKVGFYHKKTKRILEVTECLIALPEINSTLKILREKLSEFGGIVDDIVVEFVDDQLFVELKLRPKLKDGKEHHFADLLGNLMKSEFQNLTVSFCAIPLFSAKDGQQIKPEEIEFPVGHFTQVNQAGNAILQQLVLDYCKDSPEITELFAGAGNFTFPLARQAQKVVAVEADRALVKYGESLAKKFNLENKIEFVRKSCEKYVRKYPLLPCVVLDPPRCGALEVAEKVDPQVTKRIVYVSCALPTLCRDIKVLLDKGFKLKETKVVDMFPQTHHVETVSLLEID